MSRGLRAKEHINCNWFRDEITIKFSNRAMKGCENFLIVTNKSRLLLIRYAHQISLNIHETKL